ncbi:MAG TPA: FRG domain-containing protein [Rickettsiales bacterium]|nr:FRG domain-containing protein [Rickettsiales bacterium]
MKKTKISSIGELLDHVDFLRKEWAPVNEDELWFRGESQEYPDTFLRPELYRPQRDNQGKNLPLKKINELLNIENDLYKEFQRCSLQLLTEGNLTDDWDWNAYFLMQHHSAPTRLLDWSDGALMALHFAVRNRNDDDKDAVVYVLASDKLFGEIDKTAEVRKAEERCKKYVKKHPEVTTAADDYAVFYLPEEDGSDERRYLPKAPCVLIFDHITRRVAAQRSQFIVFGKNPNWLADKSQKPNSYIKPIIIDKKARPKIRRQLRDAGVTESVIFPDLDGLGRELRQLWEDKKTPSK